MPVIQLSTLYGQYLGALRAHNRSAATVAAYAADGRLLLRYLGRDNLRAFTPARLVDYAAYLHGLGHHANGICRRLASAAGFGAWLEARGHVARNPLRTLPRPKRDTRLPKPVPPLVAHGLLQVAPPRTQALLALMRYAGLRVSEVINLDVADLQGDLVRVRTGKGGRDRVIPLVAALGSFLDAWLTERGPTPGPLFPSPASRTGRLSRQGVAYLLHQVTAAMAARTPVPPVSPHMFRHSFGTELTRQGVALQYIQQLMGHADPATTMQYIAITVEDLRRVLGRDTAGTGSPGAPEAPGEAPPVT